MTESGQAGLSEDAQFSVLFAENFEDVWRFVRRRTACREDADDVTAEVFAVAWRRRGDLPTLDEQRLWLFGVARLVLSNHHRSLWRRRRLQRRLALYEPQRHVDTPDARDEVVWRALAALDTADRDLLLMRAWDGVAVADIASLLGCSSNAVSLRLRRARQRLARQLARTDLAVVGHVESGPALRQEGENGGRSSG